MKLTNIQKYAIQGMVADGKNSAEISKAIGKPEATVVNYVFKIAQSIVKVEQVKADSLPCLPEGDHTDFEAWTDAPKPVEPVEPTEHEKNMDTNVFTQEDVTETAIVGRKKASDYMIDKSRDKKEKGVMIMTAAASAIAEERAKHYDRPVSRNQSAIFKPKGN